MITDDLGLELKDASIDMLGTANKVEVTKDNTTVVDGDGDDNSIDARKVKSKHKLKKLIQTLIEKNYKNVLLN